MNTIRIYLDEDLVQPQRHRLVNAIKGLPHVFDVEIGRNECHEVVVEYEAHCNIPVVLIESLRRQGFHPDIIYG